MANQWTERRQMPPEHIEERRRFVMECKRKAFNFDQIAEKIEERWGYRLSVVMVAEDFRIIMRKRNAELNEDTDAVRTMMVDQLDRVLTKALDMAEAGSLDHAELAVKLLTRKARLLGTDAPVRTETEDTTPLKLAPAQVLERITAIQTRLRAHLNPAPVDAEVVKSDEMLAPREVAREISSVIKEQSVQTSEQSSVQLELDVPHLVLVERVERPGQENQAQNGDHEHQEVVPSDPSTDDDVPVP